MNQRFGDGHNDRLFGLNSDLSRRGGMDANWIETVPGGWFSLMCLCSPKAAWHEGKWLLGELELVR